jgi:hypothetical protein
MKSIAFFHSKEPGVILPLDSSLFHDATKEWIRTILMCNNREFRLPFIPVEMWGFIVGLVLHETFKHHGLDPIKAISSWIPRCPSLSSMVLAGSTVIRQQNWKGWDLYGDHETVYKATKELAMGLGCTRMVQLCNGIHQTRSNPLPKGCYAFKLGDDRDPSIVRIVWKGFNINLITNKANHYSFTRFDLLEVGYHYSFKKETWCAPSGMTIPKLPVFDQWTMRVVPEDLAARAIIQIQWEDKHAHDRIPDFVTFERFFKREMTELDDPESFLYKTLKRYKETITGRIYKYRERAKLCNKKFEVRTESDLRQAMDLIRFTTGYCPTRSTVND